MMTSSNENIFRVIGPWWRHQMKTFSVLLALCAGNPPVTGEFPSRRPVNKRFTIQSWGWCFDTPSRPLWGNCNAFVRGILRSPVNSPHKGQWRGALMFSLICARTDGWVNNRKAGDLRRHRSHYDVTVMFCLVYRLIVFLIFIGLYTM